MENKRILLLLLLHRDPMVGQAAPASPPLLPFHMSHRCLAALCHQMVCGFLLGKKHYAGIITQKVVDITTMHHREKGVYRSIQLFTIINRHMRWTKN